MGSQTDMTLLVVLYISKHHSEVSRTYVHNGKIGLDAVTLSQVIVYTCVYTYTSM